MSAVRTFTIVVAGTAAVGVGGYALIQLDRANKVAQELSRIGEQTRSVKAKSAGRQSEINSNEELVKKLSAQVEQESAGLADLETRVSSARQELKRLEGMWQQKQDTISRLTRERNDTRLALSNLATLVSRDLETLSTLSKELDIVEKKYTEARQLVNPLNHPEVKRLLGKA